MPGVLLVLAGNGWMRGVQRTREPVWHRARRQRAVGRRVARCSSTRPGSGSTGSAIANVAAQAVGAALFLRALRRAASGLRPDRGVMRGAGR